MHYISTKYAVGNCCCLLANRNEEPFYVWAKLFWWFLILNKTCHLCLYFHPFVWLHFCALFQKLMNFYVWFVLWCITVFADVAVSNCWGEVTVRCCSEEWLHHLACWSNESAGGDGTWPMAVWSWTWSQSPAWSEIWHHAQVPRPQSTGCARFDWHLCCFHSNW